MLHFGYGYFRNMAASLVRNVVCMSIIKKKKRRHEFLTLHLANYTKWKQLTGMEQHYIVYLLYIYGYLMTCWHTVMIIS